MARSTLTKRIEFSASHRYGNAEWDAARNQKVFGPCCQEHGHNYLLEVTLGGRVDPVTGMIINLYDLKRIVTDMLEEFDHKHLNLDTPYFTHLVPTAENLALVLWRKFRTRPETRDVASIRLCEGEDLWAELHTPMTATPDAGDTVEPAEAFVTRRYAPMADNPAASSRLAARPLVLDVTVRGPIDPVTGRVTDIATLDERVKARLFADLPETLPARHAASRSFALAAWAKALWPQLADAAGGRLAHITVTDQHELTLEYSQALR